MPLHAIHNETELLHQVANGDERAFAKLFEAYHNQLAGFVMQLTGSKQITQEIIQDVFLKAWLNRATLTHLQSFISWLFIITRNYTLSNLRKQANQKKKLHVVFGAVDQEKGFTDDMVIERDYHMLLRQAIEQLPLQQKKAYMLSREEGLDNSAIATQLGVTPGSVKKYLQWAQQSISHFVRSHAGLIIFLLLKK